MKFEPFIIEKLYEGEDIHLEDLGKFQPVNKQTTIHPGSHEFDPAGRTVAFEFNPEEKDKGFAEFIASQTDQSKEEILADIKKWVANVKEHLSNGKKVQLKNIGLLVFDFQGNVILEVDESMNFSKKSYGLPRFQQEVISGKATKGTQDKNKQPTNKETQVKKKKQNTPKKETSRKRKTGKKKTWVIPAILIIFIAAAAWYVQSEWMVISSSKLPGEKELENAPEKTTVTKEKKNSETKQESDSGEVKNQIKAPEESSEMTNKTDEQKPDKAQGKPTDTRETDKSDKKTTKAQTGDYLIIAGCFQSYENAEELVEDLKQKGYPASVQGKTPQGLHRVAYDYYTDKQKATAKLKELTQKGEEGIWLDRY